MEDSRGTLDGGEHNPLVPVVSPGSRPKGGEDFDLARMRVRCNLLLKREQMASLPLDRNRPETDHSPG